MDNENLKNIVECGYNMDSGYVEIHYLGGNMLRLKCETVEENLKTTEQSLAALHKLLDDKPIEYAAMALSGEYVWHDCPRVSEAGIQQRHGGSVGEGIFQV